MELEIWNKCYCASISISLQNCSEPSLQARRQIVYLRGQGTPHVLASKVQSLSEGKVEPPEKIALEVENKSEVKVELKLQRSVTFPLAGLKYSITPIKSFHHHLNCVYGLNFCNSNLQTTCSGSLKSSVAKRTSDHRAPHVPPEEIVLEDQNQSEVKVEPKLWLSVQDQFNESLAAKSTSDHKTTHVPLDEIALEAQNQSVKRPMNEKTIEWVMLITSVLLEAMSAVFDQVGYALMGMVISFLALFLSSLHLICKARKEGVKRSQPSGGLLDYYGLAAAVWQCFYSTMKYLYTRKNQQNPIKMCLLPFIFALFVLLFSLFKCRT